METQTEKRPRAISAHRRRNMEIASKLKTELGNLDDIRGHLGLNKKEMAELLLVDPSAWSRWSKNESKVPLHVWRSLDWYLRLKDTEVSTSEEPMQSAQIEELRAEVMEKLAEMRDSIIIMERESIQDIIDSERRDLLSEFEQGAQLASGWKLLILANLLGIFLVALILI